MAFRNKAAFILVHKPDLLIVPECENPDRLLFPPELKKPNDIIWFGSNKNKGIGIFSYNNFKIKILREYNPEFKMIIPVAVYGNKSKFILYAIWANNPDDSDGQYVEQVWKAIHYYDKKLKNKETILIGDFNSNTIWDRKYRAGNHSNVVKRLEEKGIFSCYHLHYKLAQGKEEHPTFYLYKHEDKSYHLDYCFASEDLTGKLHSVEIGAYEFWKKYSDHVPVIITFNSN
jgi:exodeoxyribonuclease III